MSRQIDLQEYKIVDKGDGTLVIEHSSGSTYTFDDTGNLKQDSIDVADATIGTITDKSSGNQHNPDDFANHVVNDTATASGDGTATTFSLSHSLGSTPSVVSVTPTSADANGTFYVSSKTSTTIDVTYASAPASGTSNLTFDLMTR